MEAINKELKQLSYLVCNVVSLPDVPDLSLWMYPFLFTLSTMIKKSQVNKNMHFGTYYIRETQRVNRAR